MKPLVSMLLLLSLLETGFTACRSTENQNAALQNARQALNSENSNASANNSNKAGLGSEEQSSNNKDQSSNNVDRYRITASGSRFSARIGVGGLLSALGHDHSVAIREFTGEAHITPGTIQPASLQLTIKAGSLVETEKGFSETDRQKINQSIHDEALETAKYPQIVFKSTTISAKKTGEGQYQVQIGGNLTLHGVTRPIVIPAQVTLKGNTLTARGELTVRHSDYQIKRISAGGGAVKAKEEITLSFYLVGSKA